MRRPIVLPIAPVLERRRLRFPRGWRTSQKDRLYRLQDLLNQQQLDFNKSFLGKTIPVLFERRGKEPNQYLGKSPHMQSVHVTSNDDMIGQIRLVKVTETFANCLKGDIVSP